MHKYQLVILFIHFSCHLIIACIYVSISDTIHSFQLSSISLSFISFHLFTAYNIVAGLYNSHVAHMNHSVKYCLITLTGVVAV